MIDLAQPALDFLHQTPALAPTLIFVVAFGESFAIVSLFVPGTVILFAAGSLAATGNLPIVPILVAAALGATAGDGISYWLGRHYAEAIERALPRYRHLIHRGIAFFARYGDASIVIGRFFGPARAVVPLAAGILRMPRWRFWIANAGSAVLWAPAVLFSGVAFGRVAHFLFDVDELTALAVLVALVLLAGLLLRAWYGAGR
jgi:membrane protein DedA with SNARE-associated domain